MSSNGRITVADVLAWISEAAQVMRANKEYLTELDSAIGDADHGINMDRGFQAILGKVPTLSTDDIGALLKGAGTTLISTVGGASGPLYGSFFREFGNVLVGKAEIDVTEFATALDAGIVKVQALGKAEPGDKTMLDALMPAQAALHEAAAAGATPADALRAAADAAAAGMASTIPLVARKGRASYLGERSAGHQDPGATSSHLLLKAAADAWSPA